MIPNSSMVALGVMLLVWSSTPAMAAQNEHSVVAANIGASVEYGRLGSGGMGLSQRSLSAVSGEVLLGYAPGTRWLVGPSAEFRWQQQRSSLASTGGTNLSGHGYSLGLGVRYQFAELWAAQLALDFLGKYNFEYPTSGSYEDHLDSLRGMRFRLQRSLGVDSAWSVDMVVSAFRWGNFQVNGVNHSEVSKQWMAGLGVSFRFGVVKGQMQRGTATEKAPEASGLQPEVVLPSALFASRSAFVEENFRARIKEVGAMLASRPYLGILVVGHTDNVGTLARNASVSRERAENVRALLVEGGVDPAKIQAQGRGYNEPVADNGSSEGRAKNRRVEIFVNWKVK